GIEGGRQHVRDYLAAKQEYMIEQAKIQDSAKKEGKPIPDKDPRMVQYIKARDKWSTATAALSNDFDTIAARTVREIFPNRNKPREKQMPAGQDLDAIARALKNAGTKDAEVAVQGIGALKELGQTRPDFANPVNTAKRLEHVKSDLKAMAGMHLTIRDKE